MGSKLNELQSGRGGGSEWKIEGGPDQYEKRQTLRPLRKGRERLEGIIASGSLSETFESLVGGFDFRFNG